MSDDLLKEATRALRQETADDGGDGRFTRARVMASLHQGKVKRRTRLAFILPIAACLAAGTAWGAATGRLPAMFHAISEAVSYGNKPTAPSKPKAPSQAPAQKPAQAAEDVPAPPAVVEAVPSRAPSPVVAEAKSAAKAEPATSAKPAPSTSSSAAFQDADGDLYRLAHEAHFDAHDYGRALSGWNAYLQAAPNGRFATEARYNRAICLLRLGRDAEARQALEPFASGKMGYRQVEARELLDELSR
jgi:TolA-binding protein